MKPVYLLLLLVSAATVLVGCIHHSIERGPVDEYPLSLRLRVTDGVRTLDRVLQRPGFELTVLNGGELTTYEALIQVADGAPRTVRSIWNGVPKDLSGELLSHQGYGPISVKGYLYDTGNPTVRLPLDTTVWMTYAPAIHGDVLIRRTDGTQEPLQPGHVLRTGETGMLLVDYTPADTFLPIRMETGGDDPIVLLQQEATNSAGRFSIPVEVRGEGAGCIRVLIENGRSQESHEYPVTCEPPASGESPDNQ
ncbi:MAG: hypothetical protein J6M23_08295 [Bacteroidales bacterium]|nr:hypothetical protein [Bacteroidales bacterium]